jgi:hypothetical protein
MRPIRTVLFGASAFALMIIVVALAEPSPMRPARICQTTDSPQYQGPHEASPTRPHKIHIVSTPRDQSGPGTTTTTAGCR